MAFPVNYLLLKFIKTIFIGIFVIKLIVYLSPNFIKICLIWLFFFLLYPGKTFLSVERRHSYSALKSISFFLHLKLNVVSQ